jgi:hypothetical protein
LLAAAIKLLFCRLKIEWCSGCVAHNSVDATYILVLSSSTKAVRRESIFAEMGEVLQQTPSAVREGGGTSFSVVEVATERELFSQFVSCKKSCSGTQALNRSSALFFSSAKVSTMVRCKRRKVSSFILTERQKSGAVMPSLKQRQTKKTTEFTKL